MKPQKKFFHVVLFVGILGYALFFPVIACAQTPSPDITTYEHWLREAFAAAQRGDRLGLEQVAEQLTDVQHVRLEDNTKVLVNNDWLDAALDTPDPDLPAIRQRLGAMLDALAQPRSTYPDDAQQQLQDMLSHPPFKVAEEQHNTLISQILEWIIRQLARIFQPVEQHVDSETVNATGWIFTGLGVILVVGVGIYLLLSMRRSIAHDAQLATKEDAELKLTSTTALKQASTLARSGDHRTAVRYLYLSSLLLLDERGLLRYDRSLTNREYLQQVHHAELQTHLHPIVDTFDRVWYGHMPLDSDSFAAYQHHVEALRKVRTE